MSARLALSTAFACVLLATSAGSASGSAFYNESESGKPDPMKLGLTCGTFCRNAWDIPVGDFRARPGKGGSFYIGNVGGFTGQPSRACDRGTYPKVQDRGWVELHYRNGTYQWDLYGEDQNPVSGSPFALALGPWAFCGT